MDVACDTFMRATMRLGVLATKAPLVGNLGPMVALKGDAPWRGNIPVVLAVFAQASAQRQTASIWAYSNSLILQDLFFNTNLGKSEGSSFY